MFSIVGDIRETEIHLMFLHSLRSPGPAGCVSVFCGVHTSAAGVALHSDSADASLVGFEWLCRMFGTLWPHWRHSLR